MAVCLSSTGRRPPPPPLNLANPLPENSAYLYQIIVPIQELLQAKLTVPNGPTAATGPFLGRRPPILDLEHPLPRKAIYRVQMVNPLQERLQEIYHSDRYVAAASENRRGPPVWDLVNVTRANVKNFKRGKHPMRHEIVHPVQTAPLIITKGSLGTPLLVNIGHTFPKTSGHIVAHAFTKELPYQGGVFWVSPSINTVNDRSIFTAVLKAQLSFIKHRIRQLRSTARRELKDQAEQVIEKIMDLTDGSENPHKLLYPLGELHYDHIDDNQRDPERASGMQYATIPDENGDGEEMFMLQQIPVHSA